MQQVSSYILKVVFCLQRVFDEVQEKGEKCSHMQATLPAAQSNSLGRASPVDSPVQSFVLRWKIDLTHLWVTNKRIS